MTLTNQNLATIAERFFERNRAEHFGHVSHLAGDALEHAEKIYNRFDGSALFFGVEGIPEHCAQYLNTGETYDSTVCFQDGKFFVSSWGDIVESAELESAELEDGE